MAPYSGDNSGLQVTVEARSELDRLPAAVEVAAFRIALEAVTNAARHAAAQCCDVRFELNGMLTIEVTDDGRGLSEDAVPGIGINSMRARAEELGGRCVLTSAGNGGTRVLAHLPVDAIPQ